MIAKSLIAAVTTIVSQYIPSPEATLIFAGDAMMHEGQIVAARQSDGVYDYSEYFQNVDSIVSSADFAVVNLETPLGGKPYSGYPCFCAPDSYAKALKDAGFDMFLLANNHMLDRGERGLRRTVDAVDALGVKHVGAYRDVAQRDSLLPLVQDVNGFKIGFLNYTYGTNGIVARHGAVVDYIDRDKIKSDIAHARQAGAELLCVTMHWGVEYRLLPNNEQENLANFLEGQGVELIIGGHPHVIQPMEMRQDSLGNKRLVAYSLGNYISNMKTKSTRGGAMLQVKLRRDHDGVARVDTACYHLVFTIPGAQGSSNYRLVHPDSCKGQWKYHAKAFADEARSIFRSHNKNVPEAQ
ncbi:MAG: CapA family protein [Clostridium sp.]|nr:CapA family protein [Clostridium sp.]